MYLKVNNTNKKNKNTYMSRCMTQSVEQTPLTDKPCASALPTAPAVAVSRGSNNATGVQHVTF
jgi:hypothetical protein